MSTCPWRSPPVRTSSAPRSTPGRETTHRCAGGYASFAQEPVGIALRAPWIYTLDDVPSHPIPPLSGQHQDGATAPLLGDAVGAASVSGKAAPLLDLRVLRDMERDFSDPAVVERFARDFAATLEEKIVRLQLALQDGDAVGAYDAVLSLTTSSAMVGAERLAQAASALRRSIAADDVPSARRSIALLRSCAADTERELLETYLSGH